MITHEMYLEYENRLLNIAKVKELTFAGGEGRITEKEFDQIYGDKIKEYQKIIDNYENQVNDEVELKSEMYLDVEEITKIGKVHFSEYVKEPYVEPVKAPDGINDEYKKYDLVISKLKANCLVYYIGETVTYRFVNNILVYQSPRTKRIRDSEIILNGNMVKIEEHLKKLRSGFAYYDEYGDKHWVQVTFVEDFSK